MEPPESKTFMVAKPSPDSIIEMEAARYNSSRKALASSKVLSSVSVVSAVEKKFLLKHSPTISVGDLHSGHWSELFVIVMSRVAPEALGVA